MTTDTTSYRHRAIRKLGPQQDWNEDSAFDEVMDRIQFHGAMYDDVLASQIGSDGLRRRAITALGEAESSGDEAKVTAARSMLQHLENAHAAIVEARIAARERIEADRALADELSRTRHANAAQRACLYHAARQRQRCATAPRRQRQSHRRIVARVAAKLTGRSTADPDPEPPRRALRSSAGGAL